MEIIDIIFVNFTLVQNILFIFIFITGCTSDQFTCTNGQCIPSADRCNDVSDCTDGSDEQGCGRKQILFMLDNIR